VALKDWHIFLLSKTNILEKEKVFSYLCLPLRISHFSFPIPFTEFTKKLITQFLIFNFSFLIENLGTQFAPPHLFRRSSVLWNEDGHFYFTTFSLKTKPINYIQKINLNKLQRFTILLY
jgi:hypothetical protein